MRAGRSLRRVQVKGAEVGLHLVFRDGKQVARFGSRCRDVEVVREDSSRIEEGQLEGVCFEPGCFGEENLELD